MLETSRKQTDYQNRHFAGDLCNESYYALKSTEMTGGMSRSQQKLTSLRRVKGVRNVTAQSVPGSSKPKRNKLTRDFRLEKMKAVEEVKHLKERMSYKEKSRQMAEDQKNYKLCNEITEEITALSKEYHVLKLEMNELTKTIDQKCIMLRKSQYPLLRLTTLPPSESHDSNTFR